MSALDLVLAYYSVVGYIVVLFTVWWMAHSLGWRKLSQQDRRKLARFDDISHQLEELRSAHLMTDQQIEEITRLRTGFTEMKREQDALAVWLRDNKQKEIAAGRHTNGLAKTIIMYLEEKQQ